MKQLVIFIICFIVTLFPQSIFPQGFSTFPDKIKYIPTPERNPYCLDFLAKQKIFPIIESDTLVHFLYYGRADSVAIAGDATAWRPSLKMTNIEGCDLWYCTASYPSDARWEYKIVVDGREWKLDSLNRNFAEGGMGRNSELQMPQYQPPLYSDKRVGIAPGSLVDTLLNSKFLAEKRKVKIYLPAGYKDSGIRYPLFIFHDGFDFLKFVPTTTILDNMIAEKLIPPVIAVFDQPVMRDEEYSGERQDKYTDYVIKELIPWLDKTYRTLPFPDKRALVGISNGGNIALWIGGTQPDVMGNVVAMSSNVEQNVAKAYQSRDARGAKIYLNFGKYDISMLIPRVQKLKTILENKQYIFIYREYPEGHNWTFWEKYLPEALQYIFSN